MLPAEAAAHVRDIERLIDQLAALRVEIVPLRAIARSQRDE
jgi:hypothetical protein